MELIPDVVTELPTIANGGITINDDGTETVRYQIRDEAVWADGTPISGDDYLFTYQTITDPDLPIDKTIYEDIDPASVVAGPKTFEFTLTQADGPGRADLRHTPAEARRGRARTS